MAGFDNTQITTLTELFERFKETERVDQTANLDFRFGQQDEKYGSILEQAMAANTAIKESIGKHEAELHRNADRVSEIVDNANKVKAELEAMTPALVASFASQDEKSTNLNDRLVKLTDDINEYATSAKAQLAENQMLAGKLGEGLQAFAEQAKLIAMAEINELKLQIQDWAKGLQQRINEGGGGQGTFRDGPKETRASGIDKKK